MRIVRYQDTDWREVLTHLDRQSEPAEEIRATVAEIIAAVRARGDAAVADYTLRFGGPDFTKIAPRLGDEERVASVQRVIARTKKTLRFARDNIRHFARQSLRRSWHGRNSIGAQVGERFDAFTRVGIYVPGGTAPLVSTALMTATLAQVAGCPEIVVTTPAGPDGAINDALIAALDLAGATEVYKIGGAQAIAALAYGTETIRPVAKIFGPGNAYVVEAKRQVFGRVAIDLLPGPSEIMVIADQSATAPWIAADLLAQAEHGVGTAIIFATSSKRLLVKVEAAIQAQLATLGRQDHLAGVITQNATLLLVRKLEDAIDIANAFAPEHLTLMTQNDDALAAQVRTAGAIFLGGWSPVAAGDFIAGPSHELPTGGAGKSFGGLTVDQFQRRTSIVRFNAKALRAALPAITEFARLEGLDAHGASAEIRFR